MLIFFKCVIIVATQFSGSMRILLKTSKESARDLLNHKLSISKIKMSDKPDDKWTTKYNFNPKSQVTMPKSPSGNPSISPFELKKPSTSKTENSNDSQQSSSSFSPRK